MHQTLFFCDLFMSSSLFSSFRVASKEALQTGKKRDLLLQHQNKLFINSPKAKPKQQTVSKVQFFSENQMDYTNFSAVCLCLEKLIQLFVYFKTAEFCCLFTFSCLFTLRQLNSIFASAYSCLFTFSKLHAAVCLLQIAKFSLFTF